MLDYTGCVNGLCSLNTNQPGIPECSLTHPVEQHFQVLEFLPVHRPLYIFTCEFSQMCIPKELF